MCGCKLVIPFEGPAQFQPASSIYEVSSDSQAATGVIAVMKCVRRRMSVDPSFLHGIEWSKKTLEAYFDRLYFGRESPVRVDSIARS